MLKHFKLGWAWLTASRKRFSLALSVVIVGLLLWSRLIMLSNMPRTAIADDESVAPNERETTPIAPPSDKASGVVTQEKSEVQPNGSPHAAMDNEISDVSISSPETR